MEICVRIPLIHSQYQWLILKFLALYFSLMEMQTILTGVLESFEFSLPPGGLDIINPGIPAAPMIRNKMHEGVQLPLSVKRRDGQV